ncbi:MAG TPA: helix-turn-helix transcriptional regulator [Terriglobia bacterium]|nr:helix-turn-helix transcriptional regulator [Terriglobia bacterium]
MTRRVRSVPRINIGSRLRELREAKGLSQYVLANRTGLLRCNIWRMEKGRFIPGLETLETLARALEVDLYQLFLEGGTEQPTSDLGKPSILGAERRKQFKTLKNLGKRDRKLLLDLAQKMASKNQTIG